jgi:hypothetical protein
MGLQTPWVPEQIDYIPQPQMPLFMGPVEPLYAQTSGSSLLGDCRRHGIEIRVVLGDSRTVRSSRLGESRVLPIKRISIPELRQLILECPRFTENPMVQTPWVPEQGDMVSKSE